MIDSRPEFDFVGHNLIVTCAGYPNTIVIVHYVGPLIVEQWIDGLNLTAVI